MLENENHDGETLSEKESQRLANLHEENLADFDKVMGANKDEREQCLSDRRFYSISGAQWEGKLGEQFENKPKLEVNKVHLSIIEIIDEYRNSRITVDFKSRSGSDKDGLAGTCDGMYRASEQDSNANEAYDNAFEEAVGGGIGAWRLRADYEDENDDENEYQKILIEPIFDADSCVFFDLGAKRQDKSDAKKCWVLTAMSMQDYENEFDDDPSSWPKEISETEFDWTTAEAVYVAEVYIVEHVKRVVKIYEVSDGVGGKAEERYNTEDFENNPELEDRLLATGYTLVREKKTKKKKVHKYLMSGSKVLKDCGYIAGSEIPIVINYGKRWFVDNVERAMGHVRLAKDMQRLKNMQISKLAEISALSPVEKPILTPEQVAGHEITWSEDNITNNPYLLLNPITDAMGQTIPSGPLAYTKPPMIPPSLAALLQITDMDIKELLGNSQQGKEIVSNISAKAYELVNDKLGMQTYIYMSNFAKSMQRSGTIWLSMAKDLFVENKREMKTITNENVVGKVVISNPVMNDDGELQYENDLSNADMEIFASVGPSTSSKRSALVSSLTEQMRVNTDPETQQVLGFMSIMNMEGEGVEEIRPYFRNKLVRMGAIEPTKEEQEQMAQEAQNQQPDPNSKYLEAAAANEQAKAIKAEADTMLVVAKTEETKVETAKTISDMETADQDRTLKAMDAIDKVITGNEPS